MQCGLVGQVRQVGLVEGSRRRTPTHCCRYCVSAQGSLFLRAARRIRLMLMIYRMPRHRLHTQRTLEEVSTSPNRPSGKGEQGSTEGRTPMTLGVPRRCEWYR